MAINRQLGHLLYKTGVAGTTSDLKALECFWRAEEHFFKLSKEDNAVARTWAENAVAVDPNFAGAWVLIGFTHLNDAAYTWGNAPSQSMKLAEECAQKALSLNDSYAAAHALMGQLRRFQGRYDEAVRYGEKAVAINPNNSTMMVLLAFNLLSVGRFDESVALVKTAMRICPYYPAFYLNVLALPYVLAGRYREAIEVCELMLDRSRKGEINPFFAHLILAEAYAGLGQIDKAKNQAGEVLKVKPNFSMESEKFLAAYKDPAYKERHFALLRKAGLK